MTSMTARELAAALLIGLAVSVLLVALTVGALAVMDWYGTFTWMGEAAR